MSARKQTLDPNFLVWEAMRVQELMQEAEGEKRTHKALALRACLNEIALAQDAWLEANHTGI